MRGSRRAARIVGAGVVAALVLAGGAAWYLRPWEQWGEPADPPPEPVTAAVQLTTLTSEVRLNGELTFGDAVPLPAATGTITVTPVAGQVIALGKQVYEANGAPVVVFRGARPFWRELSVYSRDAEDVRQLEQNLTDLGFQPGPIDTRFDWRTRQAVRDWQKSLGLEQTGAFSPSAVVVTAASGIRIARVTGRLGESNASPGTYTATTLYATAKLTPAQARELAVGGPLTVTLPDGTEIQATLSAIDPGGEPIASADGGGADGDGGESAAKKTSPSATIQFADQKQVAAAGPAAVRITIHDDEEQEKTLVVPATALLATAEDAYAVEIYRGGEIIRTTVALGLVADSRVQILASGSKVEGGSGPVLTEGDLVVLAR